MNLSTATLYCKHSISMPRIVTGPGAYRTRCGETVTVERTPGPGELFADGSYEGGPAESWFVSGRVLPNYESKNDIVGRA